MQDTSSVEFQALAVLCHSFAGSLQLTFQRRCAGNPALDDVHVEQLVFQAGTQPTQVPIFAAHVFRDRHIVGIDKKRLDVTEVQQNQPVLPALWKRRQVGRYGVEVVTKLILKRRALPQGLDQFTRPLRR